MSQPLNILVVDDEQSVREMIKILLERQGHKVVTASSGQKAVELFEQGNRYDLVITDLLMDKGTGMDVLSQAKARDPHCEVILITAFGTTESAVEAMKKGAFDYISKPFNLDEFLIIVNNALEHRALVKENIHLKASVQGKYRFSDIIGRSEPMKQVIDLCKKVTDSAATILLSGESGTGKEVVARAIHCSGPRASAKFVPINCGALPEQLMESELFGHVKGAFTGASQNKTGLFMVADKGTLFLDEIGELPPQLQVKLLRVLQERSIRAVGDNKEYDIDVRIISATNQNLEELVASGEFRKDLFYRLNVIHIPMPPLRDRREDIPPLIKELLLDVGDQTGSSVTQISTEAKRALLEYDYPGNVRELRNILERAATLAIGDCIELEDLPILMLDKSVGKVSNIDLFTENGIDLENAMNRMEKSYIEQALNQTGGVQKQAAELLKISFRSLRYRMKKLGLASQSDNS